SNCRISIGRAWAGRRAGGPFLLSRGLHISHPSNLPKRSFGQLPQPIGGTSSVLGRPKGYEVLHRDLAQWRVRKLRNPVGSAAWRALCPALDNPNDCPILVLAHG